MKQTATLLQLRGKPLAAFADLPNPEPGLKEIMKQSAPGLPCEVEVKVVPGGVDVLYVWRRAPPPEWPQRVASDLRRYYERADMAVQVEIEHPIEVERDPNSVYELDFTVMLQRTQYDRDRPFWSAWIKGREEATVSSMLPDDAIAGTLHGHIMTRLMEHGVSNIVREDLGGASLEGIGVLEPMLPEPVPRAQASRLSRMSDDDLRKWAEEDTEGISEEQPDGIDVREHIVVHIVTSERKETGGGQLGWVHTHGMEQFDLPNLEVRGVPLFLSQSASDLLNDVADYMVNSGIKVILGESMQAEFSFFEFVQLNPIPGDEEHFKHPMWALSDAPLRSTCAAPDCQEPGCEEHNDSALA